MPASNPKASGDNFLWTGFAKILERPKVSSRDNECEKCSLELVESGIVCKKGLKI